MSEAKHTDVVREALRALVRLHGEQVFINGEDDNETVRDVLLQAEAALSAPSLLADNERLREALRNLIAAEDRFAKETGLTADDPVTDAIATARAALSATERSAK